MLVAIILVIATLLFNIYLLSNFQREVGAIEKLRSERRAMKDLPIIKKYDSLPSRTGYGIRETPNPERTKLRESSEDVRKYIDLWHAIDIAESDLMPTKYTLLSMNVVCSLLIYILARGV